MKQGLNITYLTVSDFFLFMHSDTVTHVKATSTG